MDRPISLAVACALTLTACSSRPRTFEPQLASAPVAGDDYYQALETCRTLVAQGHRSDFKSQIASAGTGVAAGVGIPLGVAALGEAATYAVASTAVAFVPLAGIGAAWGMAKSKKNKKEREVKRATALCLNEHGYSVSGWKVAKKQDLRLARENAAAHRLEAPHAANVASTSKKEEAKPLSPPR